MVSEKVHEGKRIFTCGICGFGYEKKEIAIECEDFCRIYKSCRIEITSKAVFYPEPEKGDG